MVEKDPFFQNDSSFFEFSRFEKLNVASVHDRLLSFILDFLIFTPFLGLIHFVVIKKMTLSFYTGNFSNEVFLYGLFFVISNFMVIAGLHALWVYFFSATPGQMFLKVKVKSFDGKITWTQSLQRGFGFCFSLLSLGFGFVGILSHRRRQAWYERMSDTIVITTKDEPYNTPHWMELKFFEQFSFIGFSMFLIFTSVVMGKIYHAADEGHFKQSELLQASYLCESVGDDSLQGASRLDKALALFKMGSISESCALSEADFALWTKSSEMNAWGYLLKSQVYSYDFSKSDRYADLTCQNPESKACQVIRHPHSLLDDFYSARYFVYQNHLNMAQYSEAQKLLAGFRPEPEFQDFLISENMKNLWRQGRYEQAQGAWLQVSSVSSDEGVLQGAAWFCEQSLKRDSCQKPEATCEYLKDQYANQRPIEKLEIALALGFEKSCRKSSALDWKQFDSIFSRHAGFQDWVQAVDQWISFKPGKTDPQILTSNVRRILGDGTISSEIKDRVVYFYANAIEVSKIDLLEDRKVLDNYMKLRPTGFRNELSVAGLNLDKEEFSKLGQTRAPASIKSGKER